MYAKRVTLWCEEKIHQILFLIFGEFAIVIRFEQSHVIQVLHYYQNVIVSFTIDLLTALGHPNLVFIVRKFEQLNSNLM